jgi:hypothetical protein
VFLDPQAFLSVNPITKEHRILSYRHDDRIREFLKHTWNLDLILAQEEETISW